MQAAGIGLPLLNLKSLSPGRAQAYPEQDQFKSLLQQRIVSRGYSGGRSSSRGLSREVLKAQLRRARPVASASSPAAGRSRLSLRSHSTNSTKQQKWVSKPLPERTNHKLMNLKSKARQTQQQESSTSSPGKADSSSQSWKANLRARALISTQEPTQAAAVAPTATIEMPAALKKLMEFLNQQPGQALKVPADRLPEVEAFLLKAGLPPEQVENLLASPRFQEQGLTAEAIQSAWHKAVQDTLQQNLAGPANSRAGDPIPVSTPQTAAAVNPLLNITSQPDYQRLWQNLTLPPAALPELRLELQQMGVPPEALARLTEQNFPQGLPLTQVWELIQQTPKSSTAAAHKGNIAPDSPALLNGGQDVEKWRQFLVISGMDPELAQFLVSGASPTNREELRTGLLKMAPPPETPSEVEAPKPFYLPQSVRVRALPMLQQQPDAGQGETGAGGNFTRNFTFSTQTQEVNLPGVSNLENFLALLTGGAPVGADQLASSAAPGASASVFNAYLTPAARELLWSQVQSGVLGNLRPGENQITLTLEPPEMGKLHLTLNLRGEMVEVSAVATHQAVAEAGAAGVQQLAQALSQQGLTLVQFQFHHQDEAPGQFQQAFFQNSGDRRQAGGQQDPDKWEQPHTPRRRHWAGGIDCFA